jgi:signal transduction histidine kinase
LINARDALTDSLQPTILVNASVIDDWLELIICDNGVGIAQEIQQRIFDPFFTTKPPGKGTGLGLSVTRRLMQDVGGSIVMESQLGGGCRMRLRFRLWKENLH